MPARTSSSWDDNTILSWIFQTLPLSPGCSMADPSVGRFGCELLMPDELSVIRS